MHMFFFTIGGDGSRQYRSDAAILAAVFCIFFLFYMRQKICNGKTKGLALGSQNEEQNAFVLVFDFLTKMKNKRRTKCRALCQFT